MMMRTRTKNRSYNNSIRYLVYNSPQPQGFIYTSPFGAWFAMPHNMCIGGKLLIDKETRGREIRWKKPKLPVNDREKRRNRAVCKHKEMQLNKKSAESGCQSLSALFCCQTGEMSERLDKFTERLKNLKGTFKRRYNAV